MANTIALVGASKNHLVYLLTGDGTVIGPTRTNAEILADFGTNLGPLYDLFNAAYASQAAMRVALFGTGARMFMQVRVSSTEVNGQITQPVVDVDTDAVSPTKPEINCGMSASNAPGSQIVYLYVEHIHSVVE
jgi:hypothetical protein